MSRTLTAAALALGLAGAAIAAPAKHPRETGAQRPVAAPGEDLKAWFERAIERMLDESAHLAQAADPRR